MKCKCGCGKTIKPSLYYPKVMIIGGKKKIYQQREFCKGHRLSPKLKTIQCDFCHKEFKKRFSKCNFHLKHKFCSMQCAGKFKYQQNIKICSYCRKSFHSRGSRPRKYCSNACAHKFHIGKNHPYWKPKIYKHCVICKKQIILSPWQKDQILCSSQCYAKWISLKYKGSNASNWRGGISPETNIRCSSIEWRKLRPKIYKRDNYTCQKCGYQAEEYKNFPLAVHHIIPYRISKNNNPKNLITLCKWCHPKNEPRQE